jgi:hypothetical protein
MPPVVSISCATGIECGGGFLLGDSEDAARLDRERLRELVSLRVFLCCTLSGLGLETTLELRALLLRTDRISAYWMLRSGTLFE